MKLLTKSLTALAIVVAGAAIADPSGTLRESHDLGFGENSSLDPISKGRVFQMTDKLMDRLVRPGQDGSHSADLAER